ncbi:Fe-S cluster assembly protein SufD [Corynebacterium heidelbergense]|uniref:Fe-S cluster assembly protein SufD n=1 Tax=Corynebacterium heidelbergense TaxID=2055947 RepID=A0A364V4S3_9CORY|nr:Fe-S cluster assembly protein SufD [Corynebacterium heidelbergense]RAV31621.1 Fe-S cluster assembly protein SufD [Corynebacterium heidelbergense]
MTAPLTETEPSLTPVPAGTDHQTKGDRFTSFDPADFHPPVSKDEDWRFTPLRRLGGLQDGSVESTGRASVQVDFSGDDASSATKRVFAEELATDDERLGRAGAPVDYAAAYAWSQTSSANYVRVARGAALDEPVRITVGGAGEGVASYSTLVVELEEQAEAVVVLRYEGSGKHSDNVEFVVGDGARLTCVVLEDWNRDAIHLSNSHIQVGRDATVRHTYAAFGGEVVRAVPHVRFTAPGGDAELLGLYFADAGQYFEQRLLVDHSEKNCRSNVLYKGALQGEITAGSTDKRTPDARTAWIGDVLIRPDATGTDTYEKNNNLLLTPGARADSVPNLEIQTGEITGAGHAATVGRFDDEQMFYLRSRGIPETTAKMLIVRGFFTDVIRRIPLASVREQLEQKIEQELHDTVL